jgi:tannase/feruloyl esterase
MVSGRRMAVGAGLALVPTLICATSPKAWHGASAASCEELSSMPIPGVTVTLAQSVPAGGFGNAQGQAQSEAARTLPAFCRVAATLRPSNDSDIKMEVWLPVANWNGKFQAVGNGAFSGSLPYPAMTTALARGYAVGGTDTGHSGGSASFGLGHPEKVVDFGWRAVHEMTVTSKKIVQRVYAAAPKFAYWNGCSAGGRQAMTEAQRFPDDFDGIIAGSPGLDWTSRAAQAVRIAQRLESHPENRLSAEHRQLLHKAVLDTCDANDGVKDGVIENPVACSFDPGKLQCASGDANNCLTAAEVETARQMYASPKNPKSGREITGLARGSELGWTDLGWTASARATGLDQFRYLIFQDPNWNIQQFRFDTDIVRAEERDAGTINALDTNLRPFLARGGKLIQYHGWNDPQISPGNSVQYYERVVAALGGSSTVQRGYRLFMAPGMAHCGGGDGPNSFDMLAALERWVEQGQAPDQIMASRTRDGRVERTRPLCPYPQTAVYKGRGSPDDAANFVCK